MPRILPSVAAPPSPVYPTYKLDFATLPPQLRFALAPPPKRTLRPTGCYGYLFNLRLPAFARLRWLLPCHLRHSTVPPPRRRCARTRAPRLRLYCVCVHVQFFAGGLLVCYLRLTFTTLYADAYLPCYCSSHYPYILLDIEVRGPLRVSHPQQLQCPSCALLVVRFTHTHIHTTTPPPHTHTLPCHCHLPAHTTYLTQPMGQTYTSHCTSHSPHTQHRYMHMAKKVVIISHSGDTTTPPHLPCLTNLAILWYPHSSGSLMAAWCVVPGFSHYHTHSLSLTFGVSIFFSLINPLGFLV